MFDVERRMLSVAADDVARLLSGVLVAEGIERAILGAMSPLDEAVSTGRGRVRIRTESLPAYRRGDLQIVQFRCALYGVHGAASIVEGNFDIMSVDDRHAQLTLLASVRIGKGTDDGPDGKSRLAEIIVDHVVTEVERAIQLQRDAEHRDTSGG